MGDNKYVRQSNDSNCSKWSACFDRISANAWIIIGYIIVAFLGGVFPDIISHGFILSGREGHETLAIVGTFLVIGGLFWYWFSWSLVRRYDPSRSWPMALVSTDNVNTVECLYYNEELPINICRKCGRCKDKEL